MGQTKEGAIKTANTNREKHGADFYQRIGALGGKRKVRKGFAIMDKDKLKEAGRKGGTKSRRSGPELQSVDSEQR